MYPRLYLRKVKFSSKHIPCHKAPADKEARAVVCIVVTKKSP